FSLVRDCVIWKFSTAASFFFCSLCLTGCHTRDDAPRPPGRDGGPWTRRTCRAAGRTSPRTSPPTARAWSPIQSPEKKMSRLLESPDQVVCQEEPRRPLTSLVSRMYIKSFCRMFNSQFSEI
ncbi:hypothetical protein GOODEAATRI_032227, partial [Goodea atripinnis]